ncbi:hypothetical protein, partial [Bradyrhizobium sp. 166]|uniref:hypothetical protein n=1 Tax=Bradyrhizobium sp. 166 TaxID=2782638 RepID=UPI0023DE7C9A
VELLPEFSCCAERPLVEVKLIRGVAAKARVGTPAIVQQRLRTPTGPFFARFFIDIIPGLVVEFTFTERSTRLMMSVSAALWMDRNQIVGLRFQPGCSSGRHALRLSFWQLGHLSA